MVKFTLVSISAALIATSCCAGTVDENVSIGESHLCSGSRITFDDGPSGAIEASIVSGGVADGLEGRGGSKIVLDGGTISSRIFLHENASLMLKSGTVGCLSTSCEVDEYEYFAVLRQDSLLQIRGAPAFDEGIESLLLDGNSKVVIYGRGLAITQLEQQPAQDSFRVTGTLQNGSPLQLYVDVVGDINGRVILNEIPEPCSIFLFGIALSLLGLSRVPK